MRVAIFGGRGYLGQQFLGLYPDALTPSVDITDAKAVADFLDAEKPDVVINCAGKTGRPNVDWCEDHKEETIQGNVTGPLILLEQCGKRGIYWVQLGSGCIYTGDNGGKGFSETDKPNFTGSFYSKTKGWVDQMLAEFPVLQLRLRMPFDGSTEPRNLIMKLRKYNRVLDVKNSLTCIPDLLQVAKTLIEKRVTGTFNVVNPGPLSPYDVMKKYTEIVDSTHVFEKLTEDQLSEVTKAGRSNCVLSVQTLNDLGIVIRSSDEALTDCLQQIKFKK